MNQLGVSGGKIWFRVTAVLLGIGLLVWLSIEDQNTSFVIIFSGAICTWLGARILFVLTTNRRQFVAKHVFVGFGAGVILAPIAVFLMAVKTGIHGHGSPDFTIAQIQAVLAKTPYFMLAGALLGLGSGLWRLARNDPSLEGD